MRRIMFESDRIVRSEDTIYRRTGDAGSVALDRDGCRTFFRPAEIFRSGRKSSFPLVQEIYIGHAGRSGLEEPGGLLYKA